MRHACAGGRLRRQQSHYLPQHNEPVSHISSGKSRDNCAGLGLRSPSPAAVLATRPLLLRSSPLPNYKLHHIGLPTEKKESPTWAQFHRSDNMTASSFVKAASRRFRRRGFQAGASKSESTIDMNPAEGSLTAEALS